MSHTFVLEMKELYSLVIDSLAVGGGGPFIMTKEAAATSPDQRVDDVTASGPFKLAEWTKGSKLVLKFRETLAFARQARFDVLQRCRERAQIDLELGAALFD